MFMIATATERMIFYTHKLNTIKVTVVVGVAAVVVVVIVLARVEEAVAVYALVWSSQPLSRTHLGYQDQELPQPHSLH